jgi:hypothetical protein
MERKVNNNESVSMRDYVDARIDDLKEMLATIDRLNAKAIDQYSKTTDEWKVLHNDLQRKLQDDRNMFVKKEDADKETKAIFQRTTVIIMVVSIIVGVLFSVLNAVLKK